MKDIDPATLSRLRSAWLDPEVALTDLKTRFRVQTKDYPTLRAMFGERPEALHGRQRVWKEKR